MKLTYENFSERLRDDVNGFANLYQEHLSDNDEVLPHVLLGDLVRFLVTRVLSQGTGDPSVQRALALLESAATSDDPRLRNLVAVSFLENLAPEDEAVRSIKAALGPALTAQLQPRAG